MGKQNYDTAGETNHGERPDPQRAQTSPGVTDESGEPRASVDEDLPLYVPVSELIVGDDERGVDATVLSKRLVTLEFMICGLTF